MFDDISRFAQYSGYEAALRAALLMIATGFFITLATRLAMSLVSVARAKARKEWAMEAPIGKQESLLARLLRGEVDESSQQVLFTEEVRQMLARGAVGKKHTPAISR